MYEWAENNREDALEREIAELFAEFSVFDDENVTSVYSYLSYDETKALSYYNHNYENESLSDVFINWYNACLTESCSTENIETFLGRQGVQDFLTAEAFQDIVGGSAFVPTEFLYIIQQKIPFRLTGRTLNRLNDKLHNSDSTYCVSMPMAKVMELRSQIQEEKKEKKRLYNREYMRRNKTLVKAKAHEYWLQNKQYIKVLQAEYRQKNREKINHKRRQRWHENFEERLKDRIRLFKKYYQNRMTPELNKKLYYLEYEALRKHNYYLANKEAFRERCRKWRDENPERLKKILKEYRRKHAARIAAVKRRYYRNHKEVLLAKAKAWREENPDRVKETSRRNYAENREKRRAQNKEWIKNNPETRQQQKARYRAAHAAEIAAKEAARRNKKRFKNKTGAKILGLLQGIIQTRS